MEDVATLAINVLSLQMFNYKLSPFQFKITPLLKKELLPRKQSGKISTAVIVTQLAETLSKQRIQAVLLGRGPRTATLFFQGRHGVTEEIESGSPPHPHEVLWLC